MSRERKVLASVFSDCQRQVPPPIAEARKLGKVAEAGDHDCSNGRPPLVQILLSVCFCRVSDFPGLRLPERCPNFPERFRLRNANPACILEPSAAGATRGADQ